MSPKSLKAVVAVGFALAFATGMYAATLAGADSNAQPADKMAAAGSAVAYSQPGQVVTLLSGQMKTSSPEDLVITASMECDILTSVTTTGNDDSSAFGQVVAWIEIDGHPVPVGWDDTGADAGKVVFCNRAHQQTTSGFTVDNNATITSFIQTRSANSFQWTSLNLGSGQHTVELKALLTQTSTNNGVAKALVGKRSMTVEPTKLANNAVV
ncbi:MAG: hypothetical protein QOE90_1364 [Thermoplasmata archaeon]|jgi:hypothetical protein|nr:hypothetical protein [Thermoplasmata archaeon]